MLVSIHAAALEFACTSANQCARVQAAALASDDSATGALPAADEAVLRELLHLFT